MICEDYVSFETAKLLKEKGFDEECSFAFYKDGRVVGRYDSEFSYNYYDRPTLQMAMKWLREVHDIYIMIDKDFVTENGWHYVVARKQDWDNNIDNGLIQQESNSYTYEFACEAAIEYCLKNLI